MTGDQDQHTEEKAPGHKEYTRGHEVHEEEEEGEEKCWRCNMKLKLSHHHSNHIVLYIYGPKSFSSDKITSL